MEHSEGQWTGRKVFFFSDESKTWTVVDNYIRVPSVALSMCRGVLCGVFCMALCLYCGVVGICGICGVYGLLYFWTGHHQCGVSVSVDLLD